MTKMEGRYSVRETVALASRDAVLSRLAGVEWPFEPLLDLLDLQPTNDVLDVGAGDGRLLQVLQARGHVGHRVGLDPAPGGLEVRAGEAHTLPFADRSFDVVTLVRVLGHLPDAGATLAEAQRVVRPGGQVVLAAHGGDHLRETWRALGRPPGGDGAEAALREALVRAGWVAARLDVRLPVTLTTEDAAAWGAASGWQGNVPSSAFPVRDTLHLALYTVRF